MERIHWGSDNLESPQRSEESQGRPRKVSHLLKETAAYKQTSNDILIQWIGQFCPVFLLNIHLAIPTRISPINSPTNKQKNLQKLYSTIGRN